MEGHRRVCLVGGMRIKMNEEIDDVWLLGGFVRVEDIAV